MRSGGGGRIRRWRMMDRFGILEGGRRGGVEVFGWVGRGYEHALWERLIMEAGHEARWYGLLGARHGIITEKTSDISQRLATP